MSGSPVYALDGRLIGSVSYGLAASSPIAGITPAEDMKKLLSTPAAAKTKIKVNAATAQRIARTGKVDAAVADDGFTQLKVPVSVSGVAKNNAKFLKNLKKTAGIRVQTNGSRIKATASSAAEITAGSNFAAALSYGDISISGVGTTTFVCNGEAVAFGHPLIGAGKVQYSATRLKRSTSRPIRCGVRSRWPTRAGRSGWSTRTGPLASEPSWTRRPVLPSRSRPP